MLTTGETNQGGVPRPASGPGLDEAREVKLSCRRLWKVYGDSLTAATLISGDAADCRRRLGAAGLVAAVADVSFDVHAGEIFVVMGLSGSGKSTLIRCLSRLVEPTSGSVLLDGRDLLEANDRALIDLRRNTMGMVFQNFGLMPHMSVLDNVGFPLRLKGMAQGERQARAREMVSLVGLQGREGAFPHELSGGQQQRVGIARSLAVGPELWFLDEPFSALDPLIRRQMQDEFLRLQRMLRKTIVFITHDVLEAFRLADRVAIMRDGAFVQVGTPAELMLDPADDYVSRFVEDVALSRVLTAGDLVRRQARASGDGDAEGLARVACDTRLEDLLPDIAAGAAGFAIDDEEGRPCGLLSRDDVQQVLLHDRERRRRQ